ncbi:hypothetical protein ZHAS_00010812 [Anopheles sinensis]|uniref:C2H2-type domain-containing protein n=1 Tax=Anopheles sinensis TaxID=74873 RepID=A0A084VY98_ANOSI|nr:hypothetical protein ZHAS_00010812 [Anopheles sinensis]
MISVYYALSASSAKQDRLNLLVVQQNIEHNLSSDEANLLEPAHSELIRCDPLVLSNILHYCNSYHELILKIVSILDAFVPKEISGHGGCNLSVSHDEESRTIAIQYGDITEEDLEYVEEPIESECASKGDTFDEEECEEVRCDVADVSLDVVIEEIFDSESVDLPCDETFVSSEENDLQKSDEVETFVSNDQACIENDEELVMNDVQTVPEGPTDESEIPDPKYICQYVGCPEVFITVKEYSLHQEKTHPWLVETAIAVRCKYIECQALFNDIESLNSHHVTHRMKRPGKYPESDRLNQRKFSTSGIRVRKCEFCDIVMDCKVNVYSRHCLESHMREHLKTEHSQEEVDRFIDQDLWREFAVHDGEQMAECRFCYLILFSRISSRASHAERHRKEVRRSCARCGGKHFEVFCSYPKETFEAKYQRRHCAHCDRWISKKNFKEHLVTHTKERSFPCTMCSKIFKVRRTATRHIQSHVNASNRKRKCYDCAAIVEDETELPEHYRQMHPSLKPYRCSICSEGFNGKAQLMDHCHAHSDDERRAASIKCPVHSYQVGNARVFECTLCRRVFTTKRATVAHWIVHTDRPCVCTWCNLTFRDESLLETHMMDVHRDKKIVAMQC